MEVMLQAVVIVFMLFLCSLCLFAVIVIVRDIIYETARTRREREERAEEREREKERELAREKEREEEKAREKEREAERAAEKPTESEKAPETDAAEAPAAETSEPDVERLDEAVGTAALNGETGEAATVAETADAANPNSVAFSTHVFTMEEKYGILSSEFKRYFDSIVRHALSKPGVKELKHTNSYDYKDGAYRVLRIMIKRGEIVCEFHFIDKDFKKYANASNVRMKKAATTVRVLEASAVGVVKDGIDLVCTQIAEDKEYKKELARAKRREKRRKQASDSTANQNENIVTEVQSAGEAPGTEGEIINV